MHPFLTTNGAENGKIITADRSFELGMGLSCLFIHSALVHAAHDVMLERFLV